MGTHSIGEWADVVWRLLSKEHREMTFDELKQVTRWDECCLAVAIGWFARESKVIFKSIRWEAGYIHPDAECIYLHVGNIMTVVASADVASVKKCSGSSGV